MFPEKTLTATQQKLADAGAKKREKLASAEATQDAKLERLAENKKFAAMKAQAGKVASKLHLALNSL